MSSIKTNPSGTFQLVVRNKLLPEPFYSTFNSREEAAKYGNTIEGWLKQGVVPQALLKRKSDDKASWPISRCIIDYIKTVGIPDSTERVLETIRPTLTHESTAAVNYDWCEAWINRMKREDHLTPGTIKHRVGALRRCFDWMVVKHPDIMAFNLCGSCRGPLQITDGKTQGCSRKKERKFARMKSVRGGSILAKKRR